MESEPDVAVYYPLEQESIEVAKYAINCVKNGQNTMSDDFIKLFPSDIMKSAFSYTRAQFTNNDDPILYPVTIVFERNSTMTRTILVIRLSKYFWLSNFCIV